MNQWNFVIAADPQVGSPKSFRYNPAWAENWETAKKQINEINPDLLLIAGDLVRDGFNRFELAEFKADLEKLPYPVYVIPGNMDTGNKYTGINRPRHVENKQFTDIELNITSDKLKNFADFFGDLWWSFEHKGIRFSGISDVIINSGLPEEEQFWQWADRLKKEIKTQQHIWIMHYAPFINSPDEGNWDLTNPDEMLEWYFSIDEPGRSRLIELFKQTNAVYVVSGHIHCRLHQVFDGIKYDKAPAICFPQWNNYWENGDPRLGFLKYAVSNQDIQREFVPLVKTSDKKGYGPGGHPNPKYYQSDSNC
jgi:Icc-related predicted phosphoesterase